MQSYRALAAVYAFITSRITIGRRVYALGGNEKAAKLPASTPSG